MRISDNTRTGHLLLDSMSEMECPTCNVPAGESCITPTNKKAVMHVERQNYFLGKIDEENRHKENTMNQYVIEEGSVEDVFEKIFGSVPLGSGGFKETEAPSLKGSGYAASPLESSGGFKEIVVEEEELDSDQVDIDQIEIKKELE